MNCKIVRKKLVKFGSLNLNNGRMTDTSKQEWREEDCGVPLFSSDTTKVCKSCLSGWSHPENFMIDSEQNKKLLMSAKNEKPRS